MSKLNDLKIGTYFAYDETKFGRHSRHARSNPVRAKLLETKNTIPIFSTRRKDKIASRNSCLIQLDNGSTLNVHHQTLIKSWDDYQLAFAIEEKILLEKRIQVEKNEIESRAVRNLIWEELLKSQAVASDMLEEIGFNDFDLQVQEYDDYDDEQYIIYSFSPTQLIDLLLKVKNRQLHLK